MKTLMTILVVVLATISSCAQSTPTPTATWGMIPGQYLWQVDFKPGVRYLVQQYFGLTPLPSITPTLGPGTPTHTPLPSTSTPTPDSNPWIESISDSNGDHFSIYEGSNITFGVDAGIGYYFQGGNEVDGPSMVLKRYTDTPTETPTITPPPTVTNTVTQTPTDTPVPATATVTSTPTATPTSIGYYASFSAGKAADFTSDSYLMADGTTMEAGIGWEMPRAGSIVDIGVTLNVAAAAKNSSISIHLYKNGVSVFASDVISSGTVGDKENYKVQARGTDTFVAGDIITVYADITAGASTPHYQKVIVNVGVIYDL